MNNRRKQRITSLTLVTLMLLSGCSERFRLTENEKGELVAVDGAYIDNGYIQNYVVLEVYNKVLDKNEIFITRKDGNFNGIYYRIDIFTNIRMEVGGENSMFEFVKETNLGDYIVLLGLGQNKYSYEDIKNIYEVIKENYVFESDKSLRKIRTYNNFI